MSEPRTAAEAYDDLTGMLEAAAALVFDCQVLAARSRAAEPPGGDYASSSRRQLIMLVGADRHVSRALTTSSLRVIELEAQVRRLQEILVDVERVSARESLIKLLYDAGLAGGVLAAEVIQDAIRQATRHG